MYNDILQYDFDIHTSLPASEIGSTAYLDVMAALIAEEAKKQALDLTL